MMLFLRCTKFWLGGVMSSQWSLLDITVTLQWGTVFIFSFFMFWYWIWRGTSDFLSEHIDFGPASPLGPKILIYLCSQTFGIYFCIFLVFSCYYGLSIPVLYLVTFPRNWCLFGLLFNLCRWPTQEELNRCKLPFQLWIAYSSVAAVWCCSYCLIGDFRVWFKPDLLIRVLYMLTGVMILLQPVANLVF